MGESSCSFEPCGNIGLPGGCCYGHRSQKRQRAQLRRLAPARIIRPVSVDPVDPKIARVPLTQGHEAVIDAQDIALVAQFNWCATDRRRDGRKSIYAINRGSGMHRLIGSAMGILGEGLEIDHIDGNGLNNRRSNLRGVTPAQNSQNVGLQRHNTSGVKGVSWVTPNNKWRARIDVGGKTRRLGDFDDIELAAFVYQEAAAKYHGQYSRVAREAGAV